MIEHKKHLAPDYLFPDDRVASGFISCCAKWRDSTKRWGIKYEVAKVDIMYWWCEVWVPKESRQRSDD